MAEPIIWAKQTSEGRQVTNDGSELLNLFYVPVEDAGSGKSSGVLYSTPGLRPFINITTAGSGIQGLIPVDDPRYGRRLFGICGGTRFFEVRADGGGHASSIPVRYNPYLAVGADALETTTSVRPFTNSPAEAYTGPARMATDGQRVVFIRGRSVVMWDQAAGNGAGAFTPVHSPSASNPQELLPDDDWVDVIWINGYFVLLSKTGEIFHSRLKSPDFDQLDFAAAERNPDPGVGLAFYQGRFYVFGSKTIEVYREVGARTTGSGAVIPFAFGRVGDAEIPVGCAARDTIAVNEGGVFWLGDDKMVYVTQGGLPAKLSNATVDYDVARSEVWNARGYVYTEEGRRFYSLILTFPGGAKKNWTLDLVTRLWHERTNTRILSIAEFGGFNVVGLDNSQQLMSQSLNWGAENGVNVERTAVSSMVQANRGGLAFPGGFFFDVSVYDQAGELDVDAGGSVELDYSDDFKSTWKPDPPRRQPLSRRKLRFRRCGRLNRLIGASPGRNVRLQVNSSKRFQLDQSYAGTLRPDGGMV